jgi:hypothetical protein
MKKVPATSAIPAGEIPALQHEVLDDPMELGPLVSLALRLECQLVEVLHGLGHRLAEESDLDASRRLAPDLDVEPDLVRHLRALLVLGLCATAAVGWKK